MHVASFSCHFAGDLDTSCIIWDNFNPAGGLFSGWVEFLSALVLANGSNANWAGLVPAPTAGKQSDLH